MRRRSAVALPGAALLILLTALPTLACGGLIGPNGAVNLVRTTTLAAYGNGVEHYVTSFEFAGVGGGQFGSLIPLPDIPSKIERACGWTLQRLILETDPVVDQTSFRAAAAGAPSASAEVIQQVRIDALDITVLRGGGTAVGQWATDHGFRLPPDAPEVLDFYAQRSPIFLAAVFDGGAAKERGQRTGDGTPVQLTIPTDEPWVPIRILGLGKTPSERVRANVYLMTDARPNLLPLPSVSNGLAITHSAAATDFLLNDLRRDKNTGWIPRHAWLTKIAVDGDAATLTHDLAIDPTGTTVPNAIDAGFGVGTTAQPLPAEGSIQPANIRLVAVAFGFVVASLAAIGGLAMGRPTTPAR